MATDVDLFAIKERLVDILDSDTALFDATGASGKIRRIRAGAPRMAELKRETHRPAIWVTNDSLIDTVRQRNPTASNAPITQEHTFGLRLILIVDAKDGPKAEEKLDDFVQLIQQTIIENYDLRTPGGAESTSVADSCVVDQVTELNPAFAGTDKSGRIVRLKVVVTSS